MLLAMTRTLLLAILLCGLTGCGGDGSSDGQYAASGSTDAPPAPADVCGVDERITVTVVVDAPVDRVYGMHTRLTYPAGVSIPGFRDDPSVQGRVTFLPPLLELEAGRPMRSVLRTIHDEDYRVQTLMTSLDHFPDGPFVTITFDCVEGRPRPVAADFPCEVAGATDLQFLDLYDSTCRAELASRS